MPAMLLLMLAIHVLCLVHARLDESGVRKIEENRLPAFVLLAPWPNCSTDDTCKKMVTAWRQLTAGLKSSAMHVNKCADPSIRPRDAMRDISVCRIAMSTNSIGVVVPAVMEFNGVSWTPYTGPKNLDDLARYVSRALSGVSAAADSIKPGMAEVSPGMVEAIQDTSWPRCHQKQLKSLVHQLGATLSSPISQPLPATVEAPPQVAGDRARGYAGDQKPHGAKEEEAEEMPEEEPEEMPSWDYEDEGAPTQEGDSDHEVDGAIAAAAKSEHAATSVASGVVIAESCDAPAVVNLPSTSHQSPINLPRKLSEPLRPSDVPPMPRFNLSEMVARDVGDDPALLLPTGGVINASGAHPPRSPQISSHLLSPSLTLSHPLSPSLTVSHLLSPSLTCSHLLSPSRSPPCQLARSPGRHQSASRHHLKCCTGLRQGKRSRRSEAC